MPSTNPESLALGRTGEPVTCVAGTGLIALDDICVTGSNERFFGLGGSCGNVLTSLAQLEHAVAPVARLGADRAGGLLFQELHAAGCILEHVLSDPEIGTPTVIENLNIKTGRHEFDFTCPKTGRCFPTYAPIGHEHFERAAETIQKADAFYCDRVSPATVRAMETAAESGAFVVFEPSSRRADARLLKKAISAASILKVSEATSAALIHPALLAGCPIVVTTHGRDGLTLRTRQSVVRMGSARSPRLIDTCGAGDMLSAGLIHHLLRFGSGPDFRHGDLVDGLNAGMRLAALNCAFVGARGAFRAFAAETLSNLVLGYYRDWVANAAMHLSPSAGHRPAKAERGYSAAVE